MWKQIDDKHAKIYRREGNTLTCTLVLGHVAYPHLWVLQTRPQIFIAENLDIGMDDTFTPEEAQKEAEKIVNRRLSLMMTDMESGE